VLGSALYSVTKWLSIFYLNKTPAKHIFDQPVERHSVHFFLPCSKYDTQLKL